ncbi:NADH dehydrogenase [ubiquinone] 1 alpha subcomplex subunit 10, mitochondrial [Cynoglossus semilaevis]|uniref:NADH dehydrogenase [ubiquinone] 1 alpha subcomplex subunit 10, mitochondrial n=1 Tax=Cynoglossus semilaevis TaxID=244447 RepID=A0A3P8UYY9_CYNSE|nr:NADH dehydrogenase [ubiquinone] 1 alpha subcomplex subunit 10, mitochondrial [Cynoglossus semilaevis]
MALRVIGQIIPSGTTVFRAANVAQKACLSTSSTRSLRYGHLAYLMGERTTTRFNHLSRIFTVDGNLSSGKGELAKKLAESLGMLYMPEADQFYLDRVLGEKEPLHIDYNGMCSMEKFYEDPKAPDGNSSRLQLWMYLMRLLQYSDALEHLFSTGQGVVLERSPYSDEVFLHAMFKEGYISRNSVKHYQMIKEISICDYVPPHCAIYIDVPAEEVHTKLKQSGKNVSLSYLKHIEDRYKNKFLPAMSEEAELLYYDTEKSQDMEMILEDIEALQYNKGPWVELDDIALHYIRILVQNKKRVVDLAIIPNLIPEITIGAHEFDEKYHAFKLLPGKKYAPGYNTDMGDKNVWLK